MCKPKVCFMDSTANSFNNPAMIKAMIALSMCGVECARIYCIALVNGRLFYTWRTTKRASISRLTKEQMHILSVFGAV